MIGRWLYNNIGYHLERAWDRFAIWIGLTEPWEY